MPIDKYLECERRLAELEAQITQLDTTIETNEQVHERHEYHRECLAMLRDAIMAYRDSLP